MVFGSSGAAAIIAGMVVVALAIGVRYRRRGQASGRRTGPLVIGSAWISTDKHTATGYGSPGFAQEVA